MLFNDLTVNALLSYNHSGSATNPEGVLRYQLANSTYQASTSIETFTINLDDVYEIDAITLNGTTLDAVGFLGSQNIVVLVDGNHVPGQMVITDSSEIGRRHYIYKFDQTVAGSTVVVKVGMSNDHIGHIGIWQMLSIAFDFDWSDNLSETVPALFTPGQQAYGSLAPLARQFTVPATVLDLIDAYSVPQLYDQIDLSNPDTLSGVNNGNGSFTTSAGTLDATWNSIVTPGENYIIETNASIPETNLSGAEFMMNFAPGAQSLPFARFRTAFTAASSVLNITADQGTSAEQVTVNAKLWPVIRPAGHSISSMMRSSSFSTPVMLVLRSDDLSEMQALSIYGVIVGDVNIRHQDANLMGSSITIRETL